MQWEIIMIIQGNTGIKLPDLKESKADKVIESEENEGYGKAVNKGIRCASGEYIAIVNSDVQVFEGWLGDLQQALNGGLDLVQSFPMYGRPFARAVEANEERGKWIDRPNQESYSDFRDFACVLTRKDLFNKIVVFKVEEGVPCKNNILNNL